MKSIQIKNSKQNNLTISLESYDCTEKHPILLFIPDMNRLEHFHIGLNEEEANKLLKFLIKWDNKRKS